MLVRNMSNVSYNAKAKCQEVWVSPKNIWILQWRALNHYMSWKHPVFAVCFNPPLLLGLVLAQRRSGLSTNRCRMAMSSEYCLVGRNFKRERDVHHNMSQLYMWKLYRALGPQPQFLLQLPWPYDRSVSETPNFSKVFGWVPSFN